MSVSFSDLLQVPQDVMVSEIGGEAVLLNLQTEQYYGLNEVGARMWAVITESESVQQAYDRLMAEYDVEPELLSADLTKLIGDLVSHGLLEVASNVA